MWLAQDSSEARAHAKPHLSHEVVAAAASYEAAKAYEQHVRKHGKPVNHEKAVAMLAAITGGFIDRIVETRGMDPSEEAEARRKAHKRAEEALTRSGEH